MRRYGLLLLAVFFGMVSCTGAPPRRAAPASAPPVRDIAPEMDVTETDSSEANIETDAIGAVDTEQVGEEDPLSEVAAATPVPEETMPLEEPAGPASDLDEIDFGAAHLEEEPLPTALLEPEAEQADSTLAQILPPLPAPVSEPATDVFPVSEPVPVEPAPVTPEATPVVSVPVLPAPEAPPVLPPVPSASVPPVPPQASPLPAAEPVPAPPAYLGPAEERPPAVVLEPSPVSPLPPATPPLPPVPPPAPAFSLPEPPSVIAPVPRPQDEKLVFSRIVRATVGQLVEIPFRGTGWVYLGELGSRRGIVYDSRRLDPEGQSFVFRTEAAGTYALKFYKQDFVRDYILNDHVQVIVGDVPEAAGTGWFNPSLDRGRVTAEPRWPNSLEEARRSSQSEQSAAAASLQPEAARETDASTMQPSGSAEPETAAQTGAGVTQPSGTIAPVSSAPAITDNAAVTANPAPEPPLPAAPPPEIPADSPPEFFLQKAKEAFESGKIASAISLLDQFRERYPSGSDEVYWLYGQFYESNSPSRDILAALDYYRRLVREYPQSGRYNDARRRIAYLERYYINIQ
jgi:TolA-binding protein